VAVAGWYNDESDRTLARWHDGVGWTEHVVVKAEWEALGHAPPPPPDPASGRRRTLVGSAAVLALLLVVGVALARDDGDDAPRGGRTVGEADPSSGVPGGQGSDQVDGTGAVDAATSATGTNDDTDVVTDSSVARSGAPRPTAGTVEPTVQRTETSTRTQTNPGPRTEVGGGDKTSVGNTSATTIEEGYVPPPPTTTTPTTTPTTTETTATTAGPTEPVVADQTP